MKKSAIKQVFHGFRGTAELIKMTREELELWFTALNTYDELNNKLTPKQQALQEKFLDEAKSVYSEELDHYYVEGFKLGLLIGIECMEE